MSLNELLLNQRKPYLAAVADSLKLTGSTNQLVVQPNNGANTITLSSGAALTAARVQTFSNSSGELVAVSNAGIANGDILYYNAGQWNRLPIGTNGQHLTIVGGLPAWGA